MNEMARLLVVDDEAPQLQALDTVLRAEGQGLGVHVVQLAGCEAHWMAEGARIAEGNVGRNGREVGVWLRQTYGPDTVVATNTFCPSTDRVGAGRKTVRTTLISSASGVPRNALRT